MATELTMPKNDMDMEEGTIVKWLKNVGDKVEKGEMFMEIETDKTSMEIESPATGVLLAQFYQGGDVVPVNTVMGYVGEAGEAVPEQGAKAAAEEAPKEEKRSAVQQPLLMHLLQKKHLQRFCLMQVEFLQLHMLRSLQKIMESI